MSCQSQNDTVECTNRETWIYNSQYGILEMCDGHAYALMHDMAPGEVRRRFKHMSMQRVTVHCTNCHMMYRIERIGINTMIGLPEYCPMCGNKTGTALPDPEMDYWEIIAEGFHLPVSILKELYDAWDKQKFVSLRDYIEDMRAQARASTASKAAA